MWAVHSARTKEADRYNDIKIVQMIELQFYWLIETPLPTTAGKFPEEEATVWPPDPVVTPDGESRNQTSTIGAWSFVNNLLVIIIKIDTYVSIAQ